MLWKETCTPDVIELIKELQSYDLLKTHILAGGTALSLQLGHRMSEDIDIFSTYRFDYTKILSFLNEMYNDIKKENEDNECLQIYINKIKVDILSIRGKVLEKPLIEDGISYYGLKDISAMKLLAITDRKKAKESKTLKFHNNLYITPLI